GGGARLRQGDRGRHPGSGALRPGGDPRLPGRAGGGRWRRRGGARRRRLRGMTESTAALDTLPKLLLARAQERPSATALREKDLGVWRPLDWRSYRQRVRNTALGFLELGVERGDKVAILGDNRPEWVITELAAQSIGAVSMGVYQDAVTSEVQFLIGWSDAVLVVAEDQEQVDKILESRAALPNVRKVLFHDPRG